MPWDRGSWSRRGGTGTDSRGPRSTASAQPLQTRPFCGGSCGWGFQSLGYLFVSERIERREEMGGEGMSGRGEKEGSNERIRQESHMSTSAHSVQCHRVPTIGSTSHPSH